MKATATRADGKTRYEIAIPWADIGLSRVPEPGTALGLSVLVNNDGGKAGRFGLQWFFGINTRRGIFDQMGTLWME